MSARVDGNVGTAYPKNRRFGLRRLAEPVRRGPAAAIRAREVMQSRVTRAANCAPADQHDAG